MKWKIDKKYITIAALALGVILASLLFNSFLQQGENYSGVISKVTDTLSPILAGFVLAYLLSPLLKVLENKIFLPLFGMLIKGNEEKKKQVSRAAGVLFTMALFILFIVGAVLLVIPEIYYSVVEIIEEAPESYRQMEATVSKFLAEDTELSKQVIALLDAIYGQAMEYVKTVIVPNVDLIVKEITSGIMVGVRVILNVVLALIISIYVLAEKETLISYAKKMSYTYLNKKHANLLIRGIRYIHKVFGGFIMGKIIDSAIIGALCYIAMIVLGLEYPLLISLIVGVTNVIPYFGPFLGAIPSILLLLLAEPKQGLIFVIFVLILQQLDGNVIGPLILGESLNLSSMWILIAILIGGGLFGVPGMILGAPTLACIYAVLRIDSRRRLKKKEMPTRSEEYLQIDYIDEENKAKYFKDK